jgi:hypothetical protein
MRFIVITMPARFIARLHPSLPAAHRGAGSGPPNVVDRAIAHHGR